MIKPKKEIKKIILSCKKCGTKIPTSSQSAGKMLNDLRNKKLSKARRSEIAKKAGIASGFSRKKLST